MFIPRAESAWDTSSPDVTLIMGPLLLGYLFSTGLYGVLCVQVYVYHLSFPDDPRWTKIYVAALFALETVFSVISIIEAWDTLGKGWGDTRRLSYMDWSLAPLPLLSAIVTSMVHAFYCWRIHKLAKRSWKYPLITIILLISATQLVMTAVLTVHLGKEGVTVESVRSDETVIGVWLSAAAMADIIIAVTLVTILARAKKDTICKTTISKLQQVIRVIVETGVVTSCAALLDCTLFLSMSSNNVHFIMFYMLAKLYSNAIMATLNSRAFYGKSGMTPNCTRQALRSLEIQAPSGFWQDLEDLPKEGLESQAPGTVTAHVLIERTTVTDDKGMELRGMSKAPSSSRGESPEP